MKTIKQIADEIGVTKATVQKRIGREALRARLSPYITSENGTTYIDGRGESIIKDTFKYGNIKAKTSAGVPAGIGGDAETGMPGRVGTDMAGDIPENTPSAVVALVELLREQLVQKDIVIAEKDRQIIGLTEKITAALEDAQRIALQAQALNAADKISADEAARIQLIAPMTGPF